jgi:DNA replication regulator DPB11
LTHPLAVDPAEEEIASVRKRVPHQTLKLWETLLGPRGFEVVDGKLKRSPSKSQNYTQIPLSPKKPKAQLVNMAENGSVLSNFKRTNSFAVKPKEEARRQPFTRVTTTGTPATLLALQREAEQPVASGSKLPAEQSRKEGIFSGKKFRALGEANADNVKSVVEGEDGFWIADDLEDVDFVIVRLVWSVSSPVACGFSDPVIVAVLSTGQNKRRPRNQNTERNVGWRSVSLRIGYAILKNISHSGQ